MNRIILSVVDFFSSQMNTLQEIIVRFLQRNIRVCRMNTTIRFESVLNDKLKHLLIVLFLMLGSFNQVFAANRYSVASGNWNSTATWSATPGGAPGASVPAGGPLGDTVFIKSGYTVTTTADGATCTLLNIESGATLVVGGFTMTVTNATSVTGTLIHNNLTGAKQYTGSVTINPGGLWNNTGNSGITFKGGIINNGTFNAGIGVQLFNTTLVQSLTGTLVIPNLTVTVPTVLTNNGTLTVSAGLAGTGTLTNAAGKTLIISGTSSITTFTNAGTAIINGVGAISTMAANFTNTGTLNLNGSGTFAGITNNAGGTVNLASSGTITAFNNATATSQLNISAATVPITGLTATFAGNTVNYNGVAQTIKSNSYSNLTMSNSSGTQTAAGNLTVNGILTTTAGGTLNMAANQLLVGPTAIITNTGTIRTQNATGTPLPSGLTWSGTVQYDQSIGAQTIVTGTYNNLTFGNTSGIQTAGILTVNGTLNTTAGGTLNMGTNQLLGSLTTIANAGTIRTQNATANPIPSGKNWAGTGTVQYDRGGAQTVADGTYNNLNLAGTGIKTFGGTTIIGGNLTIATGVSANLGTGFIHPANSLTLGLSTTSSGTWGSTTSTALNKNNTFFAATTGVINVSTTTCTAGYWTGTTSTDWNTASNWCGGIPTASTDVVIPTGTPNQPTIATATTALCKNITINALATLTLANSATTLLNISGDFTKNGTLTAGAASTLSFVGVGAQAIGGITATTFSNLNINSGTTTMNVGVTISGNLNVAIGANLTTTAANTLVVTGTTAVVGTFTLGGTGTKTFTGTTSVTGTLILGDGGTKTFTGDVTINPGGNWNETAIAAINFAGNLINNGTYSAATNTTGIHAFTGGVKNISGSGSSSISIPTMSVTGSYTNNGVLSVSTALSGTGILTNAAGKTLTIGGTCLISTLTATSVGNIVNYNRAGAQTVKATTYSYLTLSGSGAKTTTGVTVNEVLSMEETATATAAPTYAAAALLRYYTTTVRTAGPEWPATFSATGGVAISNTGAITMNTAKVMGLNAPLIISNGATLNSNNLNLNLGGSFVSGSLSAFSAGSSNITVEGTGTQNIAGFITTGTVSMTKTSGIATFVGNISGTGLTINGSGTLNLGAGLTHTFAGNWTRSAGTLDGGSSVLKIGGNVAGAGGTFTASTSTVEFNSTNPQNLGSINLNYYNLLLSGGNTKTFGVGTAVTNNLTIRSGVIANLVTFIHTVQKLTLGNTIAVVGSWGGTASAATNKTATYFVSTVGVTGIINVASNACTSYTAVIGSSDSVCNTTTAAVNLVVTVTGGTGPFTVVYKNEITGVNTVVTNYNSGSSILISPTPTTTTPYTLVSVTDANTCLATITAAYTSVLFYSMPPDPTATVTDALCPTDATGAITITNALNPASLKFTNTNANSGSITPIDSHVDFGTPLLSNKAQFTAEGWIKFDKSKYINRMSLFGQNDVVEFGFEANNLRCWTAGGGQVDMPLSSYPTDNAWHHIAVVGNGTNLQFYIDGALRATGGGATGNYGTDTNYSTKIGWGVMDAGGVGLSGEVFNLGFWSRALSAEELQGLATGFVAYNTKQVGLLAGYSLSEGVGTTVSSVGIPAPQGTLKGDTLPVWTDPYVYSWTSVPAGFSSSSINLTGLLPGTYNLTTSLKGCPKSGSWTVNAANAATISSPIVAPAATCSGVGTQSITVAATGNGLIYSWQKDGSAVLNGGVISGQGTATLTLTNPTATDIGSYTVVVTGSCGSPVTSNPVSVTIISLPAAPTTSATAQPTCVVPTGTITVTVPTGMNYSIDGLDYSNSSGVFTGVIVGAYSVTVKNGSGCISLGTPVSINAPITNTWDGTKWSKTLDTTPPTATDIVVFNGPFTITTQLNACSCKINPGVNVVVGVPGGTNDTAILKVENGLNVDPTSTLTFENNASLVQVNDAASNTGNIVYKRNAKAMKNFDYTYWSSPVVGQKLNVLSPNTLWDKYFSYVNNSWKIEPGVTPMVVGKGYIIRTPKDNGGLPWPNGEMVSFPYAQPVQFKGVPNNGAYSLSIGTTNGDGNLIGNPYPSAMSADDFLAANNKEIDGTIYFWTHNTAISNLVYSSTDYASYNGVGGVNTLPAASGGLAPSGNIAAGQSFFTVTKRGAGFTGNVTFNNSMRVGVANSNAQFFKGTNSKNTAIVKHRVWLNLTNDKGAFKQTLVGYVTGATLGNDIAFDGESFDGNKYIDFYSINDSKNLVIQGRALPFEKTDKVPLGYKTTVEGTFAISIDKVDGVLASQTVFVEDKVTNVIHNLKNGAYSFSTLKGVFNDRFVLRYTDNSVVVVDPVVTTPVVTDPIVTTPVVTDPIVTIPVVTTPVVTTPVVTDPNIGGGTTLGIDGFENKGRAVVVSVKDHQIKINSFDETIGTVMVYDLRGRLLYQNEHVNKNEFVIYNLDSSDQFLIVLTQLINGKWITKEIVF
ncbi:T9SS sorting signal type C domain-containing protein [Flavobacterium sp. ZT3R18]|uniref:LamG-like jellyroll fold domain-containing protein n=1 Tax=Flavobacterium sp. ZT3R18 TaxID=2594429 RepID=UPI00117B70BF|nr:LamG-like jellyroll fold domain-containing protein [Flavobacterium sp. ZT3R18]TRX33532.1 T9SS sorting signal type C domain-containing protein [Flavobacterium sp. ZT3R18]